MAEKLYEQYLKELFGPKPNQIYVKYYNMWADEMNYGLRMCENKFGGKGNVTTPQNHFCYWSSRLAATPKFVSNLQRAATSECRGNKKCSDRLMALASAHKNEIPLVKNEMLKAKSLMNKEKRSGIEIRANMRKKSKQAKKY